MLIAKRTLLDVLREDFQGVFFGLLRKEISGSFKKDFV